MNEDRFAVLISYISGMCGHPLNLADVQEVRKRAAVLWDIERGSEALIDDMLAAWVSPRHKKSFREDCERLIKSVQNK